MSRSESRAITPEIGQGMLIGLSVLLAAVVGAAVIGAFDPIAEPAAEFQIQNEDGEMVVTHVGGEPVPAEELTVHVETPEGEVTVTPIGDEGLVTAGQSFVVPDATSADDVELVWNPVAFDRSETLAEHEGSEFDGNGWDGSDPLS